MGAVNARAFGLPGVRRMAMGYSVPEPIGYGSAEPTKTGGIRRPAEVELQPGQTIIRFGQKRLDDRPLHRRVRKDSLGIEHQTGSTLSHRGLIGGALEGPWWLEEGEFEKVRAYARQQGISVGAAVSALCVVPAPWSDLDVVVSAQVMAPLLAYKGKPNPADVRGTHVPIVRDNAGDEIVQLFIPGLANGDVLRQALMHGPPRFLHPEAARRP